VTLKITDRLIRVADYANRARLPRAAVPARRHRNAASGRIDNILSFRECKRSENASVQMQASRSAPGTPPSRVLLADVDAVIDGFGTPHARPIRHATLGQLRARSFPADSMGPNDHGQFGPNSDQYWP
jgi:hypothetical protein